MYIEKDGKCKNNLISSDLYACLKQGYGLSLAYLCGGLFMFNDFRWETVDRFDGFIGVSYYQCLNFHLINNSLLSKILSFEFNERNQFIKTKIDKFP